MTMNTRIASEFKTDAATRAEALAVISDFGASTDFVRFHISSAIARRGLDALTTETVAEIAVGLEASERMARRLSGRA